VPGTEIDDQLQAAVGSARAGLPTARDVYPSDWSRETALPDDQFDDATEWQTYYDLSASDELLVYVSKPIPGLDEPPSCASNPAPTARTCSEQQVAGGDLVTTRQTVGDQGRRATGSWRRSATPTAASSTRSRRSMPTVGSRRSNAGC
jgi:hypothetical protein